MSGELQRCNGSRLPAMWTAPEALRRYQAEVLPPKHDTILTAAVVGILTIGGFALVTLIAVLGGLLAAGIAFGAAAVVIGYTVRALLEGRR